MTVLHYGYNGCTFIYLYRYMHLIKYIYILHHYIICSENHDDRVVKTRWYVYYEVGTLTCRLK